MNITALDLIRYVNVRDGRTALHRACEATNPQKVALLLKRDEELANIVDYGGDTGLHLACNKGDKQTVQALLVSGCGMMWAWHA